MTSTKSIWTILKSNSSQYRFDPEVICEICKTLLQNAYSGPCGCRYCYECISQQLNGPEMYCSGNLAECQNEILMLNINTNKDTAINRKISKMIVKCPNETCSFSDELVSIDNHIKGCNSGATIQEMVNNTKSQSEIINNLINELDELKLKINIHLTDKEFLTNTLAFFKANIDGNQTQIWELQKNQNALCVQTKEINQKISNLKVPENLDIQIDNINQKYQDLEILIEDLRNDIYKTKNQLEIVNSKPPKSPQPEFIVNPEPIKPNEKDICIQYLWIFEQFNAKLKDVLGGKKNEFVSNVFHTSKDGYQICLKLQFNVYSSGAKMPIYLSLCLMKGKYDSQLWWPFEYDITFELTNPCKNEVQKSQTIFYETSLTHPGRNRPISNMNIGLGCFLIDAEEILNDSDWKKEDKFLINCIISSNKKC